MRYGDEVQPGQVVGGKHRGNEIPSHVETVGKQTAAVHHRPSSVGPFQKYGLPLSDIQYPEGNFGFKEGVDPEQRPDGKQERTGDQKAFRRVWEMIPMYAYGQCHGDRAEAKDGGPVRARGYEQIQPRVRLQPAQAMQKRLARNVRQMEQETGCLFQSGCRGDKPEERQRQDDETERRKPEQVDREPEGRAPEGIQHEGEGGELRGDGTAEGQPEKPDETAPGGTHGREPALQDFERRGG